VVVLSTIRPRHKSSLCLCPGVTPFSGAKVFFYKRKEKNEERKKEKACLKLKISVKKKQLTVLP